MKAPEIEACPICGSSPELIDDRVIFFVRCKNHQPPWPLVYGKSMRHLDHIDNDEGAEEAFSNVDWNQVEISAIVAWNEWALNYEDRQ